MLTFVNCQTWKPLTAATYDLCYCNYDRPVLVRCWCVLLSVICDCVADSAVSGCRSRDSTPKLIGEFETSLRRICRGANPDLDDGSGNHMEISRVGAASVTLSASSAGSSSKQSRTRLSHTLVNPEKVASTALLFLFQLPCPDV